MGGPAAPYCLITGLLLLFSLLEEGYSFTFPWTPVPPCSTCSPSLRMAQEGAEYFVQRSEIGRFLSCCTCCKPVSDDARPSSLQVRVNYTSISKAFIIVEWNMTSIADKVHVEVEQDYTTLCLCLTPPAANKVVVQLDDPPLPPHYGCLGQNNISVTVNGFQRRVKVRDCLDTHKETAAEVCSPQVVAAPVNVTASVPSFAGDNVNITIRWQPPDQTWNANGGTSVVDEYMLSIPGESPIFLFGNITEHTLFLSNVSSLDAPVLLLHVRAGVVMVTNPCCACFTKGSIVFGPRSTLNASLYTDVEATNADTFTTNNIHHAIVWPIAALVVVVAAIFLATILRVVYIHRRNRMKEHTAVLTSECRVPDTVFLAASTEEDEGVKRRIRHLCHILANHGFTPVYYEYVVNDQSADSPLSLGVNRWVELQFRTCEFVLFVCTKRFMEEWSGERKDILFPLVYPCRHLLDGSLTRPQNIGRFAVLFMCEDHCVPPGLLRLKRFNITRPKCEHLHSDELVNYIIKKPLLADFSNFFKHYC